MRKIVNQIHRIVYMILVVVMLLTMPGAVEFAYGDTTETDETDSESSYEEEKTIFFIDNSAEQWVGDDNAVLELVDNTSGHDHYDMDQISDDIWSVSVPESAYNITFNRMSPDKGTQWNSWSAGGCDSNNAYFADGAEYGHWDNIDEDAADFDTFQPGDVVYVDVSEFTDWKKDDARLYVNFSDTTSDSNVNIKSADQNSFHPVITDYEAKDNVYAYIISEADAGKNVLRFWRGNEDTLWNYSAKLTYADYIKGINTVKVTGWNNAGSIAANEYDIDYDADRDNDGFPDFYESLFGTDKDKADTDGDGLLDGDEVTLTDSDPLVFDSITTGLSDSEADPDNDGLKNSDEIKAGTDPLLADSDNDDLDDNDEINKYGTDPVSEDTDGDGLDDGDEIVLGFDPLKADTDGDGIKDSEEYVWQDVKNDNFSEEIFEDNDLTPSVSLDAQGNIADSVEISEYDNYLKGDERAYVGKAIKISDSNANSGHLSYKINDSYKIKDYTIDGQKTNGLVICMNKDETTTPLKTEFDSDTKTLSADIPGDGIYFVLDVIDWMESYGIDQDELASKKVSAKSALLDTGTVSDSTKADVAGVDIKGQADIVFIIDTTGSMGDVIDNTKDNLKAFAEKLDAADIKANYALIEYKDITCDGKDSTRIKKTKDDTDWYTDVTSLEDAIDNLEVDGGGDTPESAIDALEMARNLDMRESAQKFFILVTDAGYKLANNYGIGSFDEIVQNLVKDEINVSVVSSSEYKETYENLYKSTDGIFANIYGDFHKELLNIAELVSEHSNDGFWMAITGLVPRIIKLIAKPVEGSTIDTDGDSIPDAEELILETRSIDPDDFLSILGLRMKDHKIISFNDYNSDPSEEDTDDDGLNDGKGLYDDMTEFEKSDYYTGDIKLANRQVLMPYDANPKVRNGDKKLWEAHKKYKRLNKGKIPDRYKFKTTIKSKDKKKADKIKKIQKKKKISWVDKEILKKLSKGSTELGALALGFLLDNKEIAYHSQSNTWQKKFGYNRAYDLLFWLGTLGGMDDERLMSDDKSIVIWMWKGDYLNLHSGTEIGLYTHSKVNGHFNAVDFLVPMKLYLYYTEDNGSYTNIFGWEPDEVKYKQWWITGFRKYGKPKPNRMSTIGVIDMSAHPILFEKINKSKGYNKRKDKFIFDKQNKLIWIIWDR